MYVIIVGAGRVGRYLAQGLSRARDNEIVLIEEEKEKSEEAKKITDALVIHGDGTDMGILKDAGIEKADALVGATGKDEVNLLVCQIAKRNKVKITIARVSKLDYVEVFKSLGVDHVISPEISGAEKIGRLLLHPKALDLAVIDTEGIELLEFNVEKDSILNKKKVGEVPATDFLIVAIKRGEELVLPSASTVLNEKDKVWVITKTLAVDNVTKFFVT